VAKESGLAPAAALQSLADGIRLAHLRFFTLYPLALLVDGTIEAIVTLATGGGPAALYAWFLSDSPRRGDAGGGRLVLLAALIAALDAFVPALAATALVARAARSLARGRPARPFASLLSGLRRLHVAVATAAAFSVVPIAAAWFFAELVAGAWPHHPVAGAGGLLLLLLGLLLAAAILARFALATPAAVLERRGLIGAWRRSERLVEGSMWRVIGLVVLLVLFGLVVVRGLIDGGAFALADLVAPRVARGPAPPVAIAIAFARSALDAWFHLIVAAVTTLLFERLRRAKEGPDAEELQRIFA
jgi:hypothetical protein